jgi:hypothetical protein
MKKMRLIKTQSYAYFKFYKEKSNSESVWSEFLIDQTNTQFKYFYKLKIS